MMKLEDVLREILGDPKRMCGLYRFADDDPHATVSMNDDQMHEWAEWWANHPELALIARTETAGSLVSTIALKLDFWMTSAVRPALFETRVMSGPMRGEDERYSTWELAKAGHEAMVTRVRVDAIRRKLKPKGN